MVIKSIIGVTCACLAVVSINANAAVINTLNGVNYEWLELTATAGMSRTSVEAQLSDETSALFGYEYASRGLVNDLLLSYSSWDGLDGWHGDSGVVNGLALYLQDFGSLFITASTGSPGTTTTVDGFTVEYDGSSYSFGLFGLDGECGTNLSCYTYVHVYEDSAGISSVAYQGGLYGWGPAISTSSTQPNDEFDTAFGSHLVRTTSPIPVPAAAWLFASGLIGLVGFARRKT